MGFRPGVLDSHPPLAWFAPSIFALAELCFQIYLRTTWNHSWKSYFINQPRKLRFMFPKWKERKATKYTTHFLLKEIKQMAWHFGSFLIVPKFDLMRCVLLFESCSKEGKTDGRVLQKGKKKKKSWLV